MIRRNFPIQLTAFPLNSARLLKNCGQAKAYEMATLSPLSKRLTAPTTAVTTRDLWGRPSCFYCGNSESLLTREHQVPLSRGGSDEPGNIVEACRRCNLRKGTMTTEEFQREEVIFGN